MLAWGNEFSLLGMNRKIERAFYNNWSYRESGLAELPANG